MRAPALLAPLVSGCAVAEVGGSDDLDWGGKADSGRAPTRLALSSAPRGVLSMNDAEWMAYLSEAAFFEVWDTSPVRFGGAAHGESLRDFVWARHNPDLPDKPLYISGHSLGGALATIAYATAELDGCLGVDPRPADPLDCAHLDGSLNGHWIPVHAVYTFGAPRAGDNTFGTLAGSALMGTTAPPLFRFAHRGDLVTRVPYLPGVYSHPRYNDSELPAFVHIGDHGIVRGGLEGTYDASIGDHDIAKYVLGIRAGHAID